ncbi:tetratricopeptide repeat protein [Peribacillus simplex]|uniref:Secretory immunoglobulin A-binding protein EsiB n=1 Tax=Peribacillus simplex TaxID=1478 RepID=A0A9W4KWJ0_9BACI|nr:tetratricopeptide repeat protein [Peribacillus simplex]CAH0169411.1 Secretory immunoglobulin A-binding protein EsiB [Peribacillus simplex]
MVANDNYDVFKKILGNMFDYSDALDAKMEKDKTDPSNLYKKGERLMSRDKHEEAIRYYEKAAGLGSYEAQEYLAELYLYGDQEINLKPNHTKALKWFQKLAEQGNDDAMYQCARFYGQGWGTTANSKKAFDYALKSATKGNNEGLKFAGCMYLKGEGTEKNEAKGIEYLKRAARQEDLYAHVLLFCYFFGKQMLEEAISYHKLIEMNKESLNEDDKKWFEDVTLQLTNW